MVHDLDLDLLILPSPPGSWDYRYVPPQLVYVMLEIEQWVLLLPAHFTDAETETRGELHKADLRVGILLGGGIFAAFCCCDKVSQPKQLKKVFILSHSSRI